MNSRLEKFWLIACVIMSNKTDHWLLIGKHLGNRIARFIELFWWVCTGLPYPCLIQQQQEFHFPSSTWQLWIIFKPFGHFATTAGNEILDTFSIGFTREELFQLLTAAAAGWLLFWLHNNGFSCLVITQFQALLTTSRMHWNKRVVYSFRLCCSMICYGKSHLTEIRNKNIVRIFLEAGIRYWKTDHLSSVPKAWAIFEKNYGT